ncbi:unnamed protein product [Dibothriocephalus latus]|uniref:Uncharacterized protein n=1 Tax=Dibothriocephalus latus TaxID=60516 RepID=A0A3P7RID6_DIBLA|nr:unnamed protein product [Dibothriocephalus latus]
MEFRHPCVYTQEGRQDKVREPPRHKSNRRCCKDLRYCSSQAVPVCTWPDSVLDRNCPPGDYSTIAKTEVTELP